MKRSSTLAAFSGARSSASGASTQPRWERSASWFGTSSITWRIGSSSSAGNPLVTPTATTTRFSSRPGQTAAIELKGCLDGNNTNIFERPPHAHEFIIWSVCTNPGADPRHNAWSGIHTRLSAEIISRHQLVDGIVIWDMVCGTIGPTVSEAARPIRLARQSSVRSRCRRHAYTCCRRRSRAHATTRAHRPRRFPTFRSCKRSMIASGALKQRSTTSASTWSIKDPTPCERLASGVMGRYSGNLSQQPSAGHSRDL